MGTFKTLLQNLCESFVFFKTVIQSAYQISKVTWFNWRLVCKRCFYACLCWVFVYIYTLLTSRNHQCGAFWALPNNESFCNWFNWFKVLFLPSLQIVVCHIFVRWPQWPCLVCYMLSHHLIKGTVHPKQQIVSSFTDLYLSKSIWPYLWNFCGLSIQWKWM